MSDGYVKIWRKIKNTSWYRKPYASLVAQHLLREANHVPNRIVYNGKEYNIERGQVVTSTLKLAGELGITRQKVRTAFVTLSNCQFLTSKTTNSFTHITICKYNEYQESTFNKSTNDVTIKQPTDNQRITTNKNIKNIKNEKNMTTKVVSPQAEVVNSFKKLYEAKTNEPYNDKKQDYIIIAGLIKKFGFEKVVERARMLAQFCNEKSQWFTKEGWRDFTIGKLSSNWNQLIGNIPAEVDWLSKLKEFEKRRSL